MKPSDAYLLAKRQMLEVIDTRMEVLLKFKETEDFLNGVAANAAYIQLEELRDYIRNVMLWKKRDGE